MLSTTIQNLLGNVFCSLIVINSTIYHRSCLRLAIPYIILNRKPSLVVRLAVFGIDDHIGFALWVPQEFDRDLVTFTLFIT